MTEILYFIPVIFLKEVIELAKAMDICKKLKQDISSGSTKNFYLFYGEERYLLDFYKEELKKAIVGDNMPEFNLIELSGKLTTDDLSDAVDSYPVMAEKKLVIISDFDIFKAEDLIKEKFAEILSDLPEYCCLLLIYPSEFKPDKRPKLYTLMSKAGEIIEFTRSGREELSAWITKRFKALGHTITKQECEYLTFYCGSLMQALIPEIEKISAYAKNEQITREDIDAVATPNVEAVVFDLTDAIVARKYKKAIEILEKLTMLGEEPIALLALIGRQMRQIYAACLLLARGGGIPELMKMCNLRNEYPARIILGAARNVNLNWAREAVVLCTETDTKLKLGAKSEVLEELIVRLAVSGDL